MGDAKVILSRSVLSLTSGTSLGRGCMSDMDGFCFPRVPSRSQLPLGSLSDWALVTPLPPLVSSVTYVKALLSD